MDWKFMSDDVDSISLHDCDISEYIFGGDIALIFNDGFDVAAPNPLNATGRHKRTGKAAVLLKNGKFISAEYPSYEDKNGDTVPASEIAQSELSAHELEVFGIDGYENGVLTLACYDWSPTGGRTAFCRLKLSCDELLFCWNEFTDDAWFQEE